MEYINRQVRFCFTFIHKEIGGTFVSVCGVFLLVGALSYLTFRENSVQVEVLMSEIQNFYQGHIALTNYQVGFTQVLFDNMKLAILSMVIGFVPFLFISVFVIIFNAGVLGITAVYAWINGIGLRMLILTILPYSMFKVPALLLSCTLGLHLCLHATKKIIGRNEAWSIKHEIFSILRVFMMVIVPLMMIATFAEVYIAPWVLSLVR